MTEPQPPNVNIVSKPETNPYTGLGFQTRVVKNIASLVDPKKVTPENFKSIVRPFSMAIPADTVQQVTAIRETTARFVSILALTLTNGDVQKAKALLGDDHSGFLTDADDSKFVEAVKLALERDKK